MTAPRYIQGKANNLSDPASLEMTNARRVETRLDHYLDYRSPRLTVRDEDEPPLFLKRRQERSGPLLEVRAEDEPEPFIKRRQGGFGPLLEIRAEDEPDLFIKARRHEERED